MASTQVTDPVIIRDTAADTLAVTTSAAQTAALSAGVYDLWATADVYIKINSTANNVTASTGYLLRTGNTVPFRVGANDKIGAITATGTATLSFQKTGD